MCFKSPFVKLWRLASRSSCANSAWLLPRHLLHPLSTDSFCEVAWGKLSSEEMPFPFPCIVIVIGGRPWKVSYR